MLYLENFRIRLIEKEDLDFLTSVRTDPSTTDSLGTFLLTNKELQLKFFDRVINSNTEKYLVFEKIDKDLKPIKIGIIRITEIDYLNRSMCVGGDIEKSHRGKGYAKIMYKLIYQLGFDQFNMNRLWLLVLENNHVAINLYNKAGFKTEGVQRKAIYKNGHYLDYIMMSIIREEYEITKQQLTK